MNHDATKITGQIAGMFLAFALVLFVPAGTIAWPAGWVFLILFFGFVVAISYWLLTHNPGLLRERMNGVIQTGQKTWDQAIIIVTGGLFFAWLILMPLDAVRFRWSQMPVGFTLAGACILLCSFALFFLTFRENPYMSPVVRTQAERGQTVVSSGPYRFVRHPMYSGFLLFVTGTPLLLGSWSGLPVGLVLVVLVAVRAVMEEGLLQKELEGYNAYMAEVKYRLIPYVW